MPTTMPRLDGPIAADRSRSVVVDFPFGLRGGVPDYGPPFAPEAQVLATADGHPIADGFLSRVPAPTIRGLNCHPFYAGLINIWHQVRNPLPLVHAAYWDAARMHVGWVVVLIQSCWEAGGEADDGAAAAGEQRPDGLRARRELRMSPARAWRRGQPV